MKIFLTGVTGYIGGSIATALVAKRHSVTGLCRSVEKATFLKQQGIEPVMGTLNDEKILFQAAQSADAVINTADADNPFVVEVLLQALEKSGKRLIHTSGSSIVGDRAGGVYSNHIFDEETPRPIRFEKIGRVAIDTQVIAGHDRGIYTIVLCPCLIYGMGTGYNAQSIQVPWMCNVARKYQAARYIGAGTNVWSTIHIDDLVEAYLLALEKAPSGSFFFLENGETNFKAIADTIHQKFRFEGVAQSWDIGDAVHEWGQEAAHFAFGSNSRICSDRARQVLGWSPKHTSVLAWLENPNNRVDT